MLTSFYPLLSYGTNHLSPELAQKISALEKELESLKLQAMPAEILPAQTPHKGTVNATLPLGSEIQHPLKEEEALYKKCREYLAQGRVDLAEKHLNQLLDKYPHTPQAVLGHFWVGEIRMLQRNYAEASLSYGAAYGALKKVTAAHKGNRTVFGEETERFPEILAKLAFSLKMLGKNKEACITLKQLDKEYKQLPENLAWYVKHLKAELKCR